MTADGFPTVLVFALAVGGLGVYAWLAAETSGYPHWSRRLGLGLWIPALVLIALICRRGAEWWPESPWSSGMGGAIFAALSLVAVGAAAALVVARRLDQVVRRLLIVLAAESGLLFIVGGGAQSAPAAVLLGIAGCGYVVTEFASSVRARLSAEGEHAGGTFLEPLAACVCGVVLAACLAGTVHYAYTAEAAVTRASLQRHAVGSTRRSAQPRETLLPKAPAEESAARQSTAPDVAVLHHALIVGALLFALGAIGLPVRRRMLGGLLAGVLLPAGVVLMLTAFGRFHRDALGGWWALLVLAVGLVQVGIGLAVVRGGILDATDDAEEISGTAEARFVPPARELSEAAR